MEGICVPANSTASCFLVDAVDLRLSLGDLGDMGLDDLPGEEGVGLGI